MTDQDIKLVPTDAIEDILDAFDDDRLAPKTERIAREMAEMMDESHYAVGKRPSGLAAACLLASAVVVYDREPGPVDGAETWEMYERGELTQREIAETTGVGAVTIRNHYREVLKRWRAPD